MAKNKQIGLIISNLDTENSSHEYAGILKQAEKYGYSTCVCMVRSSMGVTKFFYEGEYHIFDIVYFQKFDALIVDLYTIDMKSVRENVEKLVEEYDKPVIAIDCDLANAYKINSPNYEIQKELIEHLIQVHGRKKINYVSGPLTNKEARLRCDAYIDVMNAHGMFSESRIYEGRFYLDDGVNALNYFDNHDFASDYDAIVCANDMSALSMEEELMRRGRKVPQEVSVTGIDNIREAEIFYPGLTTASKNNHKIGETAIELLHRLWDGEEIPMETNISHKIIYRGSCGCEDNEKIDTRKTIIDFAEKKITYNSVKGCIDESVVATEWDELKRILDNFLAFLKPKAFMLFIDSEYAIDLGLEDSLLVQKGHVSDKFDYRIAIAYIDGMRIDVTAEESSRYMTDWYNNNRHEIFCSPIHFQDISYGYIMFDGTRFPFMEGAYWDWILSLSTAINSLRYRQLLGSMYRKDALTDLYNRYGLEYYGGRMMQRCKIRKLPMMFLFIDLDRLKPINDTYGHEEGDYAIGAISAIIRSSTNYNHIGVRYGGDEFLIIGIGMDEKAAQEMKTTIIEKIKKVNDTDGKPYELSASMGYFIKEPWKDMTMDECIQRADEIMYKEKIIKKAFREKEQL